MTQCEVLASEVRGMFASVFVVLVAYGQIQSWTTMKLDTGIVSRPWRESLPHLVRQVGERWAAGLRLPECFWKSDGSFSLE